MAKKTFLKPSNLFAMVGPRFIMPRFVASSVIKITPEFLRENKVNTVLFDMDNTLAKFHATQVDSKILAHIRKLQKQFNVAVVTNFAASDNKIRLSERISTLTKNLKVKTIIPKHRKPDARAFTEAMGLFGSNPDETVIVGDRILTDIAGGNQAKVLTVYVRAFDLNSEPWYYLLLRYVEYLILGFYTLLGVGKRKCQIL